MKPAAFDYVRAGHLDEVLDVLRREGGDARIIAGGQSLMPMLNMRLAKPKRRQRHRWRRCASGNTAGLARTR
jgi:CO/xanthine dehydrogenase FAD-binding subunit